MELDWKAVDKAPVIGRERNTEFDELVHSSFNDKQPYAVTVTTRDEAARAAATIRYTCKFFGYGTDSATTDNPDGTVTFSFLARKRRTRHDSTRE